MMNLKRVLISSILFCAASHANAFFFFFPIPGSVLMGKANVCVKEGAEVGQEISSPNGNTAKILSVSGSSMFCKNPALPIRAELEFKNVFFSKAGVDIPEELRVKELADVDHFNGIILKASYPTEANRGVVIMASPKKANMDIQSVANRIEQALRNSPSFKDTSTSTPENIVAGGTSGIRFEVTAKLNTLFGQKIVYQVTVLEGDNEFVIVNAYIPEGIYDENKAVMKKISESITGLHNADQKLVQQPASNGGAVAVDKPSIVSDAGDHQQPKREEPAPVSGVQETPQK